ncbi:MAG: arsenic resistance N-acetyltransferase ArsN2 [Stenotrophomonas sp.]|uniref:arsenic resistance N-acetyltransferase ArsN2 n=1 Tax=Stenotrophomonas sp. TaxID=69392 RepID=UPI003D6CB8DD
MTLHIRPATEADLPAIQALLSSASLPCADLTSSRIDFLAADNGAGIVGVIGVEPMQPAGLLRSLAVSPDLRGSGLGKQLVAALEAHAALQGITGLTLLTETAAPFFMQLGYAPLARDHVVAAIAATAEFRSLCPASATCLHKYIS